MKSLLAKALLGSLFLLGVLALALFGSAGTLDYWQAWVYLTVFTGCSLLITAYLFVYDQRLLTSRVQAGPTVETERSQQIIQSLASLCFISLFVSAGLDRRWQLTMVQPAVSLLAAGGVVLGFGIVFLVFRANSYTSAIIEVAAEQQVITSGPYRLVRHPMYAGAGVLLLSSPPALGSWLALVFVLLLLALIIARLRAEEVYLRAHLADYAAYCHTVPYRLIPWLW
jgi:protein-S-isoprenylcysteine O-methyltransferase Ste14